MPSHQEPSAGLVRRIGWVAAPYASARTALTTGAAAGAAAWLISRKRA
ncbi:hypothetical protein PGH47_30675 [Streptomyces sp. HUAS 31]|nr:hypothetical protein [Streptomyces sp. HUAS 31]WCD99798.1 hypothetical protein PGH47_30675 [Streptomyces sp. HUAS 31]